MGVTATGIVKAPVASGVSRCDSTTTLPPAPSANWTASQRSAGHVVVTELGIAARLNQYGYAVR